VTAVLLTVASPVAASVVTFTYEGTLDGGQDETGVFGRADTKLAGRAFTAVFVRDDAIRPIKGFHDDEGSGFTGQGAANPMRGYLTIGGTTVEFGQTKSRQTQEDIQDGCGPKCDAERFEHFAENDIVVLKKTRVHRNQSNLLVGGGAVRIDLLPGPDYRSLPSIPFDGPFNYFLGEFTYFDADYDDGELVRFAKAEGSLSPHSLMVTVEGPPPAAVPEPGTWALTIAGFGAAGMALRRRRGLGRSAAIGSSLSLPA
jgi:hypothetical protein